MRWGSYAGAKGRAEQRSAPALVAPTPELSDGEKAAIAERVHLLQAHEPGALDFFRALHKEGMVEGWRSIVEVTLIEGNDENTG